jgi:hypothetical protein
MVNPETANVKPILLNRLKNESFQGFGNRIRVGFKPDFNSAIYLASEAQFHARLPLQIPEKWRGIPRQRQRP